MFGFFSGRSEKPGSATIVDESPKLIGRRGETNELQQVSIKDNLTAEDRVRTKLLIQVGGKPICNTLVNIGDIIPDLLFVHLTMEDSKYQYGENISGYTAIIPEQQWLPGIVAVSTRFALLGQKDAVVVYSKDHLNLMNIATTLYYMFPDKLVHGVDAKHMVVPAFNSNLKVDAAVPPYQLIRWAPRKGKTSQYGGVELYHTRIQSVYVVTLYRLPNKDLMLRIEHERDPTLSKTYKIVGGAVYMGDLLQPHVGIINEWNREVQRASLRQLSISIIDRKFAQFTV
jgi:hypothetical protein